MSPSLIKPEAEFFEQTEADRSIFPDGLKTSGQQEPVDSVIRPYEKFPKEITGPTVWKAADFKAHPEKWVHAFTDDEVAEISAAADEYMQRGLSLTAISKVRMPSSNLSILRPCSNSTF